MSSRPQRSSAIAEPISADVELALLHIPARLRDSFGALFAIDAAMSDVVARSTDPALGRIKLAWWREQLEALDRREPPAEPRLSSASIHLLPRGVAGSELAELEGGWATLLDPEIDPELVGRRGETLFGLGARLLQASDPMIGRAGRLYALVSAGRRGLPELFEPARQALTRLRDHRFHRSARPLTMLARAAARDLDRNKAEGSRGRAAAMLAHRWSGRIG